MATDAMFAALEEYLGGVWMQQQAAAAPAATATVTAGAGMGAGSGNGTVPPAAAAMEARAAAAVVGTLSELVKRVTLQSVFEALATNLSAQKIELICRVVDKAVQAEDFHKHVKDAELIQYLAHGLGHPAVRVGTMAASSILTVWKQHSRAPGIRAAMTTSKELLAALLTAMLHEDVALATRASKCLVQMGSDASCSSFMATLAPGLAHVMQHVTAADSVRYVRVLHLVAALSGISEANFSALLATGALTPLLQVLSSDDILLQLNVVALLPTLAGTAAGGDKLQSSGVIAQLLALAGCAPATAGGAIPERDGFMGLEALRALTAILKVNKAAITGSQVAQLLTGLKAFLSDASDVSAPIAAMHCITEVSTTAAGRAALLSAGPTLKEWLEFGTSSVKELQAACLHALARAIEPLPHAAEEAKVEEDGAAAAAAPGAGEKLFGLLGVACNSSAMAVIMEALKLPFDEVRIAAYDVLTAAAIHSTPWAITTMFSQAGFAEHMLNPSTEPSTGTKRQKHQLLEAIVLSPHVGSMNATLVGQLKKAALGGPFRQDQGGDAEPDVAMATA